MAALEDASELEGDNTDTDVVGRIALAETEIENRFPGQLLTPFKRWKESAPAAKSPPARFSSGKNDRFGLDLARVDIRNRIIVMVASASSGRRHSD